MTNQTCSLLLKDLFSYDIKSCYPTIMNKQFYDFKNIDLNNKEKRNIFIGTQQIDNLNLSTFLQESVDNLIKFYIIENDLSENDIIVTQKDGFIVKKILNNIDEFIKMDLREYIDFLILSVDRKKFLYVSDGKVSIKGMPYYYDALDKIYNMFANLNFYDKSVLFDQMENIKKSILESEDKKLFLIPTEENKFIIKTYKGDIEIKDPDFISISQINKIRYFNHFFKDFLSSIYLESY